MNKAFHSLAGPRRLILWFWLGTTAVLMVAMIAAGALYMQAQSFQSLQHTYDLITSVGEVLWDSTTAVAGRDGYLLTGHPDYLELYQGAREALPPRLEELAGLANGNPKEQEQVENLRSLVRQTLQDLQSTLQAGDREGLEAARALISKERSERLLNSIRQLINEMEEEEQSKLTRFAEQRRSRTSEILAALAGSVLLAGSCLLLGQKKLVRSVSRLKKAKEELQVSERRYQIICDQAPVGIYETDAQGRGVYTNDRWSTISGLSAAESRVWGWIKAVHPDDVSRVVEGWQAAARQNAAWEYRIVNPQGRTRWVRALGSPTYAATGELTGYVGTVEDVTEGKLAEQALRESAMLNQAILNSLPANIAVVDRSGAIQAVNESWKRFSKDAGDPHVGVVDTGADYLEVCRRSAAQGSEEARLALTGIQAVLDGKRRHFEMTYPCHSETEKRWFRMIVAPMAAQAGGAVIAHMDITERKGIEDRFQLVFEAAPAAMVMVDQEGKIVLVNSQTEKLFGYEREELLGQLVEILVPEQSRQSHPRFRRDFVAHASRRPMGAGRDLYGRRKDGTLVPVEIALNPIETGGGIRVLSVIVDVTERRRAEAERQKFVSLADRSVEFIRMSDPDLKPFYVNPAGMRLLGIDSLEEACRVRVPDYFFPEDRDFIINEFFPRVRHAGRGEVEIRFRHFKTGAAIWMLYNVFSIYDAEGALAGWATVSRNITERKQTEQALEKSRQELKALAGRLFAVQEEERERISRELHDDLNQKLALLAFDAKSLVLAPPILPGEMRNSLINLQTKIVALSKDVRQIAHQLHPAILVDLGLAAALRELCEEFSDREAIEVVFDQESIPEAIPVDVASCLYRVAQEALHNALKHAHASRVRVKVGGGAEDISLCIEDDGKGFDTDTRTPGYGLGIIGMKERVLQVHGKFSLTSQPGRGARVVVSVPLPTRVS